MIHENPDSLFTIAFYLLLDPIESIQLFRMIAATELIPWATTVLAVGYAVYLTFKTASNDSAKRINATIDLDNTKVVHNFDIEDLEPKTVFCRCWKSKKFPYCDGSHNKHNETTGDNVGPLIIQKK